MTTRATTEVGKALWRNAISNYGRTVLRMVLGLFMFRMLYQHLSKEDFGLWSLLWSLFGYGVLVDFGLGFAAQKRVAELAARENWEELGTVLSSILAFFLAVAAVVLLLAVFGSGLLLDLFKLTPGTEGRYRPVIVTFFLGLAVGFPLGVFPEILRGLQRISTVNSLVSAGLIANFLLLLMAMKLGWGLLPILIIALACTIGPDLVCGYMAFRALPKVRVSPRLVHMATVRSTMRFSVFAYLITFTNIILAKTDQLVISSCLAVSAVAIYVAGAKVSEMFSMFTRQLQDTLSPAAAHLRALGEHEAIRRLLEQGTRLSVMIATPLFVLCVFYMKPLIRLLTGDKSPAAEMVWVGTLLLVWHYGSIITNSVSKRVFVMCGHERRLMWLGVWEAVGNLALSVGLVFWMRSVVGVAIGSLVPGLLFGWLYLWPWVARECGVSSWELFRRTVLGCWLGCVPMIPCLAVMHWLGDRVPGGLFVGLALGGCVGLASALPGLWLWALTAEERARVQERLGKLLRRGAAAKA